MDNPYEFRSYSFRDTMRKYFGNPTTRNPSCSETNPFVGNPKPPGHPHTLSSSLSIRVLAPKADLIDCATIELTCQAKGIPTITLDHLKDSFKPQANMGPTYGLMADWNEYPVGYLALRPCKCRERASSGAEDEFRALIGTGLAVDPRYRRRGVGRALLSRILGSLNPMNRRAIAFRVHERQLAAQVFFRSHGFLMTQINKDAYPDGQSQYFFTCRCDRDGIETGGNR
jgi:ribosomal protein S18 acetylase RimI-like enzyme